MIGFRVSGVVVAGNEGTFHMRTIPIYIYTHT